MILLKTKQYSNIKQLICHHQRNKFHNNKIIKLLFWNNVALTEFLSPQSPKYLKKYFYLGPGCLVNKIFPCIIQSNIILPSSYEIFKSIWNRFQLIWPSCERLQNVSNRFQTNLAQTYLQVGLKSIWNRFEDINRHVNTLAT